MDSVTPTESLSTARRPPLFEGPLQWTLDRAGIALVPAASYYLVFSYEKGYCATFGIPSALIEPNLTVILAFSVGFFTFIPVVTNVFDGIRHMIIAEDNNNVRSDASRLFSQYLPIIFFGFIFTQYTYPSLMLLGSFYLGVIILVTFDIIAALKNKTKTLSFISRLRGPIDVLMTLWRMPPVHNPLFGKYGSAIFLIYIASHLLSLVGMKTALREKWFFVPSAHQNSIVIRFYGEKAICAVIDIKTKQITPSFFSLSIDREKSGDFEWKYIGDVAQEFPSSGQ